MKASPTLVLINGKNPLSRGGGYQTYTYNLAKLLTSLGYCVHLFCFGRNNGVRRSSIGTIHTIASRFYYLPILRSVEVAGLVVLAPILARTIGTAFDSSAQLIVWGMGPWTLAGAILKAIRRQNTHLVSYYPTTFAHEFQGTRKAVNVNDHGFRITLQVVFVWWTLIPFYSLIERLFLGACDTIVTHYRSAEKILSSQFGIAKTKLVRLPYYTEPVARIQASQTAAIPIVPPPLVAIISRHDGRKGINYLLHACVILNRQGIRYSVIIVGTGMLLDAHRRLAKRLNVSNVFLLGFVADPLTLLKKADLYVFPSVEEGSSAYSILEAMQFGLPIVATNVDGIPEDLDHEQSALLVPPFDPEILAASMRRLLEDRVLARRLGRTAKARYQAISNRQRALLALEDFINHIAKTLM